MGKYGRGFTTAATGGLLGDGGTAGNVLTGGLQNSAGGARSATSSWGDWGDKLGFSNKKGDDISSGIRKGIDQEWDQQQGISDSMKGIGENYYGSMSNIGEKYLQSLDSSEKGYQAQLTGLRNQASKQATDAQSTYDNNIKPGLVNAVEQSQKELYDENGNPKYMTYLQAQDPNNTVAKSFRGFYDTQAQNEGRAGMADVGIMQNMGAQAMANQMGGMSGAPMTGAQMQMMQGSNMSQAGQAMANVQQRQNSLRQQGIDQGWLQTQAAYERGEAGRDRQMKNIGALQSGQGTNIAQQQGLRGEMGGYDEGTRGSQERQYTGRANTRSGLAGIRNEVDTGYQQRQSGIVSGRAGAQRGMDVGALQASNAGQAGKLGIVNNLMSGGGFLGGGLFAGGAGQQPANYGAGNYQGQGTPNGGGQGANAIASMFSNRQPAGGAVGQTQQGAPAATGGGGTNSGGVNPSAMGNGYGLTGQQNTAYNDPYAQRTPQGGQLNPSSLMSMFMA